MPSGSGKADNISGKTTEGGSRRINVKEKIGEYCITFCQGEILRSMINEYINDRSIVLDLKNVKSVSAPFFNGFLNKLVMENDIEYVKEKIEIKNAGDLHKSMYKLCLKHLEEYKDPRKRKIINEVMRESE